MQVLIADDHPLFRDAIRTVLEEIDGGLRVVEAGTCDEVLDAAQGDAGLDLVLLDLAMPGPPGQGLEVIARLGTLTPDLPVVVLSASEEPEDVQKALAYGAQGYIPKSMATEVLRSALQLVLAGGVYVPPALLRGQGKTAGEARTPGRDEVGPERFTPRQWEVLKLLRQGFSNKEIARALDLSPETVKVHLAAAYRELGVHNRTQAVMALQRLDGDGETNP